MDDFNEPILEDDYPIYGGYLYVGDGTVLQSPLFGTVADLKRKLEIREVRRCDMLSRGLLRARQPAPEGE